MNRRAQPLVVLSVAGWLLLGTLALFGPGLTPRHAAQANDQPILNEVLAWPIGANPQWVELYNPGVAPIDMAGWLLADSNDAVTVAIQASNSRSGSTHLEPGGYLVIDIPTTVLDFNNIGNDQVRLLDSSEEVRDTFLYRDTEPGRTYARLPNGSPTWHPDQPPSPGSANMPQSTPTATPTATLTPTITSLPAAPTLLLNEVLPVPGSRQSEWIELYNADRFPVSFRSWSVRVITSSGSPRHYLLPATTLLPGAWLVVPLPTGALPDNGATLILLDDSPLPQPIDQVVYPALARGTSFARLPDGSPTWQATQAASPGAPNLLPAPTASSTPTATSLPTADAALPTVTPTHTSLPTDTPTHTSLPTDTPTHTSTPAATPTATSMPTALPVLLNEILASPGAPDPEWVELFNPANAPATLTGWSLRRISPGGTVRTFNLDTRTLPAQGQAVFELRSAFLPNDGAQLDLLDAQGRLRDSIVYPALARDTSFARLPDGSPTWQATQAASPGAPNLLPALTATSMPTATSTATSMPTATSLPADSPTHTSTPAATPTATSMPTALPVLLNEILASPGAPDPEWVELFNPANAPATLTGWSLRRISPSGTTRTFSLDTRTLPAQGQAVFELRSAFLPNDGAQLDLLDAQGRLRDSIVYPALARDTSFARLPDGSPTWQATQAASPGAPNLLPAPTATGTPTATLHATSMPTATITPTATSMPTVTPTAAIATSPTPSTAPSHTPTPRPPASSTPPRIAASTTATDRPRPSATASSAPAAPRVLLNELLAAPPRGQPEWVELFNSAEQPAPLAGWSLRRTSPSGTVRTFSLEAVVVPARGVVVLTLPSAFLTNGGAALTLLDAQQRIADALSYPALRSEQSYARERDGAASWRDDYPPSPGAPNLPPPPSRTPTATNTPPPTSRPFVDWDAPTTTPPPSDTPLPSSTTTPTTVPRVLLNELLAAPQPGNPEWIELLNLAEQPATLTGWSLRRTSPSGTMRNHSLETITLPAMGLAQVTLPGGTLPNGGATLALLNAQDEQVVAAVRYPALATGQTYARAPDGSDAWRDDYPPSPGVANQFDEPTATPDPTPAALSEVPARTARETGNTGTTERTSNTSSAHTRSDASQALSITRTLASYPTGILLNELLPAPGETDAPEWVELINQGTQSANLRGWYLEDAAANRVALPADSVLAPGAVLVLTLDRALLNNSGDTLTLYYPDGTPADSMRYTSSTPGQSYSREPTSQQWSDQLPPSPGQPNPTGSNDDPGNPTRTDSAARTGSAGPVLVPTPAVAVRLASDAPTPAITSGQPTQPANSSRAQPAGPSAPAPRPTLNLPASLRSGQLMPATPYAAVQRAPVYQYSPSPTPPPTATVAPALPLANSVVATQPGLAARGPLLLLGSSLILISLSGLALVLRRGLR